jgi:hypothetical protein
MQFPLSMRSAHATADGVQPQRQRLQRAICAAYRFVSSACGSAGHSCFTVLAARSARPLGHRHFICTRNVCDMCVQQMLRWRKLPNQRKFPVPTTSSVGLSSNPHQAPLARLLGLRWLRLPLGSFVSTSGRVKVNTRRSCSRRRTTSSPSHPVLKRTACCLAI